MDRRTIFAVALCFFIFMGWQKLYVEPRLPKQSTALSTGSSITTPTGATPTSLGGTNEIRPQGAVLAKTQTHSPTFEKLNSETGTVILGDGNAVFSGWDLNNYRVGLSQKTNAIDLKTVTQESEQLEIAFDLPEYAYLSKVQGTLTRNTDQTVTWNYEDENVKLSREVQKNHISSKSALGLKLSAAFKKAKPNYAFVSLKSHSPAEDPEAQDRQLMYWSNQTVERVGTSSEVKLHEVTTPVKWIASSSRYFLMTVVADSAIEPKALAQPLTEHSGKLSLVYPVTGNAIEIPLKVYFGPKELNLLRSVDPTLDATIDFGWFTLFAYPLLKLMKGLYSVVHNYGVAIILLTLIVKILTFPLTYKSMKSMKEMAKIQPQLQALKEKFKDNREMLNKEMLGLMKSHGYNPAAGCLPILVQMPVFFALYRVLYSSIELYHAPFFGWIADLSDKDPFYVTPVLMTIAMYLQQKLTPNTTTDPAQQKMMQFMPLMFGGMMLGLPSGLTIYMLVNALTSIVQQSILNKKFGIGTSSVSAPKVA